MASVTSLSHVRVFHLLGDISEIQIITQKSEFLCSCEKLNGLLYCLNNGIVLGILNSPYDAKWV